MTFDEAEQALGKKLTSRDEGFDEDCWYTFPVGDVNPQATYIMRHTKVVRIDVLNPDEGTPVKTDSGFSIGSDERSVREYYGARLSRKPNLYWGQPRRILPASNGCGPQECFGVRDVEQQGGGHVRGFFPRGQLR
jgi:hypothetical protein